MKTEVLQTLGGFGAHTRTIQALHMVRGLLSETVKYMGMSHNTPQGSKYPIIIYSPKT